jgi:hypothetical protein
MHTLYLGHRGIRIPRLGGITSVIVAEHCRGDNSNLRPGLPPYPLHQLSLSKQLLHSPLKDSRRIGSLRISVFYII